MPTFKMTLLTNDRKLIGSLLVHEDIEILDISKSDKPIVKHKEKVVTEIKDGIRKGAVKPRRNFHHPSGKRITDFIIEFLHPDISASWGEINKFILAQGYGKSSINNGLDRLIKEKKIKRNGKGIYSLAK